MRFSSRSHRAHLRSVTPAPAPRRRDGFTMPELLIAIVVIAVGMLSLATGSVAVLRQIRWGSQSALAALVATQRMEYLRSQGCTQLGADGSTSATTRGLGEKWVIATINGRAKAVVESVKYAPRAGLTRYVEMKSVVPCA